MVRVSVITWKSYCIRKAKLMSQYAKANDKYEVKKDIKTIVKLCSLSDLL